MTMHAANVRYSSFQKCLRGGSVGVRTKALLVAPNRRSILGLILSYGHVVDHTVLNNVY